MSSPSSHLFDSLNSAPPPATRAENHLSTQLDMSPEEKNALALHVKACYENALVDHDVRTNRVADEEDLWRNWVGLPGGERGRSNFRVPLIAAITFAKHAREIAALFGQSPAIEATPTGPIDAKVAKKISLGMKWQFYENMRAQQSLALCLLRRLKHGRAYCHIPWVKKYYDRKTRDEITGEWKTERVLYREGPEIGPLTDDEIILPASLEGKTNFDDLQTAEFIIRRYFALPTEMLRQSSEPGEPSNPEGDHYQGVRENWGKIIQYSRRGVYRDSEKDKVSTIQDEAEGVERDNSYTHSRRQLLCLEWHGEWFRWAKKGDDDAEELDQDRADHPTTISSHEMEGRANTESYQGSGSSADSEPSGISEAGAGIQRATGSSPETFLDIDSIEKEIWPSNLIVRFFPDLNLVLGIQDADVEYPDTPYKRPFWDCALLHDGQYHSMGLTEMIRSIEEELTNLANQVIESVDLSIGAPLIAERALGEGLAQAKWEKNSIIWVANAAGAKQLQINPNVEPFKTLWQMFLSLQEMLTGITQNVMGRALEQPNAPRTLGQQRLNMGAGDVRLELDMRNLHEDLKRLCDQIWDYWTMFGTEQEFFRVTGGDSEGAFLDAPKKQERGLMFRVSKEDQGQFSPGELHHGWGLITGKERHARFDWALAFADDAAVKEQHKQDLLAIAQLCAKIPLTAQDGTFWYRFLTDFFEAFGMDFTQYTNEPPPPFAPRLPVDEWSMMLRAEDVSVHPNDDDEAHIRDHEDRFLAMDEGKPEDKNEGAMFKMQQHIAQHVQSRDQKQRMQALVQGVAQMLQQAGQQQQEPGFGGIPVGPPQQQQIAQ